MPAASNLFFSFAVCTSHHCRASLRLSPSSPSYLSLLAQLYPLSSPSLHSRKPSGRSPSLRARFVGSRLSQSYLLICLLRCTLQASVCEQPSSKPRMPPIQDPFSRRLQPSTINHSSCSVVRIWSVWITPASSCLSCVRSPIVSIIKLQLCVAAYLFVNCFELLERVNWKMLPRRDARRGGRGGRGRGAGRVQPEL